MDKNFIIELLESTKNIMAENKNYLIDLDSIVGDGDLGLTMSDGFAAAFNAVSDTSETDIGKILYFAGKAMASAVPSTMGTLMASGLMNAGKTLRGTSEIDLKGIADLYAAYMEGVASRGKAKTGEKTFLDGIDPAIRSLRISKEQNASLKKAAQDAYTAAEAGFKATKTMLAIHGRAAARGEASRTLEDPGAAVAMLMMQGLLNIV